MGQKKNPERDAIDHERLQHVKKELEERIAELQQANRILQKEVSKCKRTEEALHRSEHQFRSTVNSMWDAVHVIDQNHMIRLMNDSFMNWNKELGFGPDMEGKKIFDVCPFLDEEIRKEYEHVFRTGKPLITENRNVINGQLIITETRKFPIKEDEQVTRVVTVIRDITKSKRAEEELRESEERFKKLSSLTFEGILIHENGVVIDINDSLISMIDYTKEDLIGANVFDKFIIPEYQAIVRESIIKNITSPYEIIVKKKDGTLFPVEVQARNTTDGGKIFRVVAVRDITERKKDQAALRESEYKFREMANLLPQIVFEADLSGKLTFVNEQAYELFGYSKDDIEKGLHLNEMIIPEDMERAKKNIMRIMRGDHVENHEYEAKRKNGSTFPVMIYSNPVIKENHPIGLRGIVVDISERKQAEDALRESEDNLRTILNSIGDAVIATDTNGRITGMNPVAETLTGWGSAEAEGKPLIRVFNIVNVQTREKVKNPVSHVLEIGEIVGLANHTLLISRDGTEYQISDSGAPIRDREGNITGVVLVFRDMTEKLLSQQQIEEEKFRAEFYLDLLSHDIGNIHQGIQAWTSIAIARKDDLEGREKALQKMDELEKKSIKLVRNVLLLSRLKDMKPALSRIDIAPMIGRSIDEVKTLFAGRDFKISFRDPNGPIEIMAEPVVEEVFFNLLHNGVKFQQSDIATLWISLETLDEEVVLDIADHGIGIPDDQKELLYSRHIKGSDYGYSGIGLSLVKELVTRYGGRIEVMDRVSGESRKGARFRIIFPLAIK